MEYSMLRIDRLTQRGLNKVTKYQPFYKTNICPSHFIIEDSVIFAEVFPGVAISTQLNHWGRVTHICVGSLTVIGSDNALPPGRRQAIIWTNTEILLFGPLATKPSEIIK